MMKKSLFMMLLCVTQIVAWGQTQASHSVYKFTAKAAAGGLYTNAQGTPANVTVGEVCSCNYFVHETIYSVAPNPSTSESKVFITNTYYVYNDGVYTTALNKAYNAVNQYATVTPENLDFSNATTEDYKEYIEIQNKLLFKADVYGNRLCVTNASTVSDIVLNQNNVNEGLILTPVNIGDPFDDTKIYVQCGNIENKYINGFVFSPENGWESEYAKTYLTEERDVESFKSTAIGKVYVENDGIYTAITSTDYTSGTTYFTVTFNNIEISNNETTIGNINANFETFLTVNLQGEELYFNNNGSWEPVVEGSKYLGDGNYYEKSESYIEKNPAQLLALGYVNAETTYYDCDIKENIAESSLTITANTSYATYKTFIKFIEDNPDYVSQFKTVEIKSETQNDGNNLAAIFAAIQPCNGVLNLILNDVANYGYDATKDEIKLANLIGTSIKRVVLPKCATWNDVIINKVVKNDNEGTPIVPIIQAYNTSTTDFTVHSYVAGSLSDIAGYHYTTDEVTGAYWIEFGGNLNTSDLAFISGVQTGKINMMSATVADAEKEAFITALSTFTNSNITYLGLPDLGFNKPSNTLVDAIYDKNPQLIGIGHVNLADKSFYGSIRDTKDAGGNTVHNEGTLMILTGHDKDGEHRGMANVILGTVATKEIHLAGNLNAKDVTREPDTSVITGKKDVNGNDEVNDVYLSNSGHWVTTDDSSKSSKQYGAFSGMENCVVLDFTDAKFEKDTDLNPRISGILNANTTKVLLPTDASFTTIPHFAFNNTGTGLTSFIIPGNIKDLGDYAFYNDGNIHRITTTKVDSNGNGSYAVEDIIDNGEFTMTLPAGLTHIGTSCFWNDNRFTDVYVLATKAPACERDAFDSNSYTGNNGFDASKGVNQGAYCSTERLTFAVLHYPSSLYGTEEEKKYTDPTRVYTLEDNDHKTDANGNILTWPSQSEWNHAYVTATTGTIWGAWTQEETVANTWTFDSNLTLDAVETKLGRSIDNQYKYTDYIGWHQFILANRLNSKEDKDIPTRDYSRFKENDWYTICVPYNLRKSDLLKIFGAEYNTKYSGITITTLDGNSKTVTADVYPEVRTLIGVTRNDATGQITLKMSRDLTESANCLSTIPSGGAEPDYTTYTEDDPIVIKEGYPYIIRPYLPADKKDLANAGQYLVQVEETGSHIVNNGVRVPYTSHIITALDQTGKVLNDWTYQFVGAYTSHKLPAYSYYMSKSKSKQKNIWFYFQPVDYNMNATTPEEKAANEAKLTKTWNPYGSIIAAKPNVSMFIPTSDEAKAGKTPSMSFQGDNDDFTEPGQQAKSSNYVMLFDEGNEATGIHEVNNQRIVTNNMFYNLNGQSVGTSSENIPSGIYIINGKKVIVK